jgi:nitroimidazol reductase NimA-like FMN-containing flavoprotein (pyridoxamine 5'-phosphate oxidase superfamily)
MRRNDRKISGIQEIEEMIKKADVCRIALANNNIPYIVTMNFGYVKDPEQTLYFHCANTGKKLDMIRQNNYVCFEMDIDHQMFRGKMSCDWGMKFRSIIGYGNISVVTEHDERILGLNSIMTHYGGDGEYSYDDKVLEKTTILSLKILEMTGKKK